LSDFFIVCVCAILGLAAHGATRKRWLEWVLRIIIAIFFVGEGLYAAGANLIEDIASPGIAAFSTRLLLFPVLI